MTPNLLSADQIDPQLGLWRQTEAGHAQLINLSENHTFLVEVPDRGRFVLRVHRPGYQSAAAIGSELAWIETLRTATALTLPKPLAGCDGAIVQSVRDAAGAARRAVLFEHILGHEPRPDDALGDIFAALGRHAAMAHRHAGSFTVPPGFERPQWSAENLLDPDGLWGDWRQAPGVTGDTGQTLAALDARLRADLASYGTGPERFGLIHADMRLANLLVDGDRLALIDFDDCGFGWFLYDFAAAISFFEDSPDIPALKARWLAGYTAVRALDAVDLASIDTMVMVRRMALLAWIGSHGETALAQQHAADFAAVTARLARSYLARPAS